MAGEGKFIDNLMAKNLTADGVIKGTVQIEGDLIAAGVTCLIADAAGKALLATGTTVPADGGAVYAKGCLFIDTNVATGTGGLYCNKGTAAACAFTLVTQA